MFRGSWLSNVPLPIILEYGRPMFLAYGLIVACSLFACFGIAYGVRSLLRRRRVRKLHLQCEYLLARHAFDEAKNVIRTAVELWQFEIPTSGVTSSRVADIAEFTAIVIGDNYN